MRVFFGLELPAKHIVDISDWRDRELHCDGRAVPPENFHITLAFVGNVKAGGIESLLQETDALLDSGTPGALALQLDQVGYFQKPGIFWLGSSTTPPALAALAAKLRGVAASHGGRLERKPLQPHVTLYRRCDAAPPAPPSVPVIELAWRDFTLFESIQGRQGVHYQAMAHWSLV